MEAQPLLVAQALSLAGLIAGTGEYAAILRRREAGRRAAADEALAAQSGLQALVRISLAADEAKQRRRR